MFANANSANELYGAAMRLDAYLTAFGFAASRTRAKNLIESGRVGVDGKNVTKPAFDVPENAVVTLAETDEEEFVGLGGKKLAAALEQFGFSVSGRICADIGASTGGFTDCMLQNGAVKVYAIDVGYGQLAWKLRCDERVINLERINIRHVTEKEVPELLDFASVDVSFISLKLVLPVLYRLLKEGGEAVCLIKPQFEAGRELVGKKGVVREESTHVMVVENALSFAKDNGFTPIHLTFSPVKGPEGNIEYLMHLKKGEYESDLPIPAEIVRLSHQTLSE